MSKAASPSISTTAINEVLAAADCRLDMVLVGAKASDAEKRAATASRRKHETRDMVDTVVRAWFDISKHREAEPAMRSQHAVVAMNIPTHGRQWHADDASRRTRRRLKILIPRKMLALELNTTARHRPSRFSKILVFELRLALSSQLLNQRSACTGTTIHQAN